MACPCQIVTDEDDAAHARIVAGRMRDEVLRIEAKYSRYRDDSIVSRINAAAGTATAVEVDEETAALVDYAATARRESDGSFDVTAGVLRRAWNFSAQRVPSAEALAALLPLIGWQRVHWQRPRGNGSAVKHAARRGLKRGIGQKVRASDRKSTRLNSSHSCAPRMPSAA